MTMMNKVGGVVGLGTEPKRSRHLRGKKEKDRAARDVAASKMPATWMNNSNKGEESKKMEKKKNDRCKLLLDVQRERTKFDRERGR
jgi:gas vesicle protein